MTDHGTLAYIFPKLHVCVDKPESDLPARESYNIHTVMKEEGGGLRADGRPNDFVLQMREDFWSSDTNGNLPVHQ